MRLPDKYDPIRIRWIRSQIALYEATDGREGGTLEGKPIIIVTNRGAKTGELRKTPLMRIRQGGSYIAVASDGGAHANPAWYFNMLAHPLVEVRDGASTTVMRAREVSGAEKTELWRTAGAAWPHFHSYRARTSRDIPIIILEEQ